jgi:hypothetical protein
MDLEPKEVHQTAQDRVLGAAAIRHQLAPPSTPHSTRNVSQSSLLLKLLLSLMIAKASLGAHH